MRVRGWDRRTSGPDSGAGCQQGAFPLASVRGTLRI
jgi:hypothetical protein